MHRLSLTSQMLMIILHLICQIALIRRVVVVVVVAV